MAITRYPRRAFLGFALFVGQAFLYNAVVFDLGTLLHEFFFVGSGSVPYYMALFAVSNFFGPLLLGRFFDTIGRIPMISGTYLGSAALVAVLGVLLITSHITLWEFMGFVLAAFFLASAGASAAYLTVSEVFPMETRALAIAFFFAIGTATGGIVGPVLFGQLIHSGSRHLVAIGFFVGAGAMAFGGLDRAAVRRPRRGQSLENIAKPLTVEEAEELLPLPLAPELPPNPSAYHERHEAVRAREQAESERATAAERRAALQQLRGLTGAGRGCRSRVVMSARPRRQSSTRRASTRWPPRTRNVPSPCTPEPEAERRIHLERAAAAEQRRAHPSGARRGAAGRARGRGRDARSDGRGGRRAARERSSGRSPSRRRPRPGSSAGPRPTLPGPGP